MMTFNINSQLTTLAAGAFDPLNSILGAFAGQRASVFSGDRSGTNIRTGSGDDKVYVGGETSRSSNGDTPDGEPIAANEHGRIWSDPHFMGGDYGTYDIQGEAGKTYNLLSDSGLQLNGQFDTYQSDGTAVGKTGLAVTGEDGSSSRIAFSKDGSAEIDGEAMVAGQDYTLADGGTARLEDGKLTVTTAEGYTIEQAAKGGDEKYINIDVYTGENGVGNDQLPGGLLGQSFDADDVARSGNLGHGAQGEGAIDGVVQDYEMNGLFTQPVQTAAAQEGPIDIDTGSGDDKVIIGGNTETETEPAEPVAANETGRIWGDPHFVGGDGGKYDVQGEAGKIYDLLSDSGLALRGRFDAWSDGITVVGETGLTVGEGWNSDNVEFRKDGTAYINDHQMEEGEIVDLADGGTAKLEGGKLTVTTAEGYTIVQTANGSGDSAHINIDVSTSENGVDNGQLPGGLLGQTFDADDVARNGNTGHGAQGEGAINGDVSDYECSSLDPVRDGETATGETETDDEFQELMELLEKTLQALSDLLEQLKAGEAAQSADTAPATDGNIDTGSGDDVVEFNTPGHYDVELGSGDDEAYVNLEDEMGNSSVTIAGGSGDDTVTLAGAESDYTVSQEDGYNVYTDHDGNAIKVADDVENVQFEAA
jgi:hypothetical protein